MGSPAMASEAPLLVTGAGGCIGAWIVARLVSRGRAVVAVDIADDRRRLCLAMPAAAARAVPWEVADIGEAGSLDRIAGTHGAAAIVHLAALQIPSCAADPVAGARVNVVGQVNALEAARRRGIRLVYASSVAALAPEGRPGPDTLYGVYKRADEELARLYWQDWRVSSIGIRPHTVYGPGRDQGLTSAPTKAMLAAAAGRPYTMPIDGVLMMQHVHEVADAFVRCADAEVEGAHLGDLEGEAAALSRVVALIRRAVPDAVLDIAGETLRLPADRADRSLRRLVGDWPRVSLEAGIEATVRAFRELLARGAPLEPEPRSGRWVN